MSADAAAQTASDGHVLVVDDNRDVLTALRLLLKEHVPVVVNHEDLAVGGSLRSGIGGHRDNRKSASD